MTAVDFLTPHETMPNTSKTKCMAKNSFAYIVGDICSVVNLLEPNAFGAYAFFVVSRGIVSFGQHIACCAVTRMAHENEMLVGQLQSQGQFGSFG